MAIILRISVDNPSELLNAGAYGAGAVMRVQSSATEAGVYADISGTGSTPTVALVATTRAYTGYDPAGTTTTWYRTRYENAGGTILGDWSDSFQTGVGGLTSLDAVKRDLEKLSTDTTVDDILLDYITEISDYIHGHTQRSFLPDTTTVYLFDGYDAVDRGRSILVPQGVQSLTTLEVASNTGGSFTTLASTDFFLRPSVQDRSPGWPATEVRLSDTGSLPYFYPGIANIQATGVFGFASVPARIEGIARRTVVRAFASRQAGQADALGVGGDGGAPLVSQYLSKRDREVLATFATLPI